MTIQMANFDMIESYSHHINNIHFLIIKYVGFEVIILLSLKFLAHLFMFSYGFIS